MQLRSATVLLLLGALVVLASAERQRFCYKRVGYTRKHAETLNVQTDQPCEGAACATHAAESRPITHYKTEVVYRTERHCCAGYQRAPDSVDSCVPVCSRGCPQGETCTAPNRCECAEGHQRDSDGRCVAVSAPLPGGEPTTLQSQILSYVNSLLDGVKSLVWQEGDHEYTHSASSLLAAHKENPLTSEGTGASSHRTVEGEVSTRAPLPNSGAGLCRSNGTGLENSLHSPWLSAGALDHHWNNNNCSSEARPLVLPVALGGRHFAAAESW